MPLSGRYGVFEVWIEGDESAARSATPDVRTLAHVASPALLVSYAVAALLAMAGSVAVAQVPASRAARMDPARTLRETG